MQKGGVAKTTNSLHLAVALAEREKRVLLWDLDENYGATKVLGIPEAAFWTTMTLLSGECLAEDAVIAFDDAELDFDLPQGVDFIPSSRELQGLDSALSSKDTFYNPNDCLRPHIEALRALRRYDYIVLDTGPHASPTTRGAYMAADYFVLSVIPEKQAVASLPDALNDIANARRPGRNPKLCLLGVIISCIDRRKSLSQAYERAIGNDLRDAQGQAVNFSTTISSAAAIDRAYQKRATVLQTEPSHRVAAQYRALAEEVEDRIAVHRRGLLRVGEAVANG
jgi:chromosome partitioning protein